MKKVLFISNYKENTGYGTASRRYIKAIKTCADIDLVVRNVSFGGDNGCIDFLEEEKKDVQNVDLTIVNTLPDYCDAKINSKTGCLFYWEADPLPEPWVNNIKSYYDFGIVANKFEHERLSEITKSYKIPIPFCGFSQEIEEKQYDFKSQLTDKDTHVFASVSTLNERKNIFSIVMAYFIAFQDNENVILSLHLATDSAGANEFAEKVKTLKTKMKLKNYPKVLFTHGELSEEHVENVIKTCDTYVSLSHGESWNLPMFDAAVMGKDIITSNCYGNDYLYFACNWPKKYNVLKENFAPCLADSPRPYLYNSSQVWQNPNILEAVEAMRRVYLTKSPVKINNILLEEYSLATISKEFSKLFGEIL
jgi:hypothetical protein